MFHPNPCPALHDLFDCWAIDRILLICDTNDTRNWQGIAVTMLKEYDYEVDAEDVLQALIRHGRIEVVRDGSGRSIYLRGVGQEEESARS